MSFILYIKQLPSEGFIRQCFISQFLCLLYQSLSFESCINIHPLKLFGELAIFMDLYSFNFWTNRPCSLSCLSLWILKFSPSGVIREVDGLVSVHLELVVTRPFYGLVVTRPGLPVVVCGFFFIRPFFGFSNKFNLFVTRRFCGLGNYIRLMGGSSTLWTTNISTLCMIRPVCGLQIFPPYA